MAQLGILEGRIPPGARNRVLFGGTLASSRTRRDVGPAFFGARVLMPDDVIRDVQAQAMAAGLSAATGANIGTQAVAAQLADRPFSIPAAIQAAKEAQSLSSAAGMAAGRGMAASAAYNAAKTAALSAGLSAAKAEAIAASAGQAAAAGLLFDAAAAIRNAGAVSMQPSTPAPDPTTSTPVSVLATQEQLRQYYEIPAADASAVSAPTAPALPATPPAESPEDTLRHTFPGSPAGSSAPTPTTPKSLLIPVAALAAAYFFLKG